MCKSRSIIAIIDDDGAVRRAFQRLLAAAEFEVMIFAGGAEFLRSLDSARPDCIVLDLEMRGMCGSDVQAHLTAVQMSIPIVVVTASDTPEARTKVMEAGASAYLIKPVEHDVLLQAINIAIESKRHGADHDRPARQVRDSADAWESSSGFELLRASSGFASAAHIGMITRLDHRLAQPHEAHRWA